MNAMTCDQARDQLDLLAAGACDPPTRAVLERHLEECAACAASYAEAQRLQGLLDLHWNQGGVERVRGRVEEQARGRRRRVLLPFLRRAAAVAALVLVALGLGWWSRQWDDGPLADGPPIALLVLPDRHGSPAVEKGVGLKQGDLREAGKGGTTDLLPGKARGDVARERLVKAWRAGTLPPPTAVPLTLTLTNTSARPVELQLGKAVTALSLDVQGDGVVRLPAPAGEALPFLRPQTVRLGPGGRYVLRLDRLVVGTRDRLEYVYLTGPGEYRLTARLRLTADGRAVTVTGPTVRVRVVHGP
jgi:hypothetical protein